MEKELWSATLTKEMVAHLKKDAKNDLIAELEDAVANICQEYGVE